MAVASNPQRYATSFPSFLDDIGQLIKDFPVLAVSHQHHTSQAILLALILRQILPYTQLLLVSDHAQLEAHCQMFATETEADTPAFVKTCLEQAAITPVDLHSKQVGQTLGESHVVVVDLLGLAPIDYYLQVDHNLAKWKQAGKLVLYYGSTQQTEIDHLLKTAEEQGIQLEQVHVQLAPPHPVQLHSHGEEEEYVLMETISTFLHSISPYAEKQDILVFYPLDEPFIKYLRRLKEHLVKAGLKEAAQLITEANQKSDPAKSNLFLASSNQQLKQWRYDYSRVLLVVDYGFQERYSFDYHFGCWTQIVSRVTQKERCERMLWVGTERCGLYHLLDCPLTNQPSFLDYSPDIAGYLAEAIRQQHLQLVDFEHPRVKQCLAYLQSTGVAEGEGT
jgi:hypothetical protein